MGCLWVSRDSQWQTNRLLPFRFLNLWLCIRRFVRTEYSLNLKSLWFIFSVSRGFRIFMFQWKDRRFWFETGNFRLNFASPLLSFSLSNFLSLPLQRNCFQSRNTNSEIMIYKAAFVVKQTEPLNNEQNRKVKEVTWLWVSKKLLKLLKFSRALPKPCHPFVKSSWRFHVT